MGCPGRHYWNTNLEVGRHEDCAGRPEKKTMGALQQPVAHPTPTLTWPVDINKTEPIQIIPNANAMQMLP